MNGNYITHSSPLIPLSFSPGYVGLCLPLAAFCPHYVENSCFCCLSVGMLGSGWNSMKYVHKMVATLTAKIYGVCEMKLKSAFAKI